MDVMMVRAFNHIGPNQTPLFVVADFCKQVAEIEKGIKDQMCIRDRLSFMRVNRMPPVYVTTVVNIKKTDVLILNVK